VDKGLFEPQIGHEHTSGLRIAAEGGRSKGEEAGAGEGAAVLTACRGCRAGAAQIRLSFSSHVTNNYDLHLNIRSPAQGHAIKKEEKAMRIGRSILAALMIGLGALAAGCGSGGEPAVEGELHIFNWEDYFAPTTLEDFEAEFGVEVFLETFDDENAATAAIQSDPSAYDVVILDSNTVAEMANMKLIAELDLSNIPNLANIDDQFLDQPSDPDNRYGVPYAWGSTGIVYNTKHIESPVESWALLRDPDLAGRVALVNDYYSIIGLTLKSLGYSLNSVDPEQLEQVVEVVRAQEPLLVGFLDPIEIREQMVSEELWAAQLYNGDAAFAMWDNEDLDFFIPTEGSDFYVDTLAIPRDAKNKAAAEAFFNYILRPEVHADIGNYTEYAIPNRAAVEQGLIDEELLASEVSYPPRDFLEAWAPFGEEKELSLWNKARADIEGGTTTTASR
jgi:spermidine/putrescine transport system substrate-binding protein